jgi:hypothetical protein
LEQIHPSCNVLSYITPHTWVRLFGFLFFLFCFLYSWACKSSPFSKFVSQRNVGLQFMKRRRMWAVGLRHACYPCSIDQMKHFILHNPICKNSVALNKNYPSLILSLMK